jgi:hypothetical protein
VALDNKFAAFDAGGGLCFSPLSPRVPYWRDIAFVGGTALAKGAFAARLGAGGERYALPFRKTVLVTLAGAKHQRAKRYPCRRKRQNKIHYSFFHFTLPY